MDVPLGRIMCSSDLYQADTDAAPQALAAAAELAIPHFVSASIFAVAGAASPDRFRHNLRMLMVRMHVCARWIWVVCSSDPVDEVTANSDVFGSMDAIVQSVQNLLFAILPKPLPLP